MKSGRLRVGRCATLQHATHVAWQRPASENTSDLFFQVARHCLAWSGKRPCSGARHCGRPRARHPRLILLTHPPGTHASGVTAPGVTTVSSIPLPKRTWNSSLFLKAAAQGAAQRPTSRLEHRTLGIRLIELAGNPPADRAFGSKREGPRLPATAPYHGEVFHTNLNTYSLSEGKLVEAC